MDGRLGPARHVVRLVVRSRLVEELVRQLLGAHSARSADLDQFLARYDEAYRALWERGFEELLPADADWLVIGAAEAPHAIAVSGSSLILIDTGEIKVDQTDPPPLRCERIDLHEPGLRVRLEDVPAPNTSAGVRRRTWSIDVPGRSAVAIRSELRGGTVLPREERVARAIAAAAGWALPDLTAVSPARRG